MLDSDMSDDHGYATAELKFSLGPGQIVAKESLRCAHAEIEKFGVSIGSAAQYSRRTSILR